MRIHVDNLDGFNAVFETTFSDHIFDLQLEHMPKVRDWSHFNEICDAECRRFCWIPESVYLSETKEQA